MKWADGKKFEDKIVATLKKYGYKGSYMSKDWLKQPIFIQSFAATSLVYISNMTDSPKVFLIDDVTILTEDTFFFVICWINIKTGGMQSNTHKPARNTFLPEPEAGKDRNLSRAIKDNY